MSGVRRFSARLILTAILCFAPSAFGQDVATAVSSTGSFALNRTMISAVVIHHSNDRHSCDGDRRHDEHCQSVPEGGSASIYLLLAGLACIGAMALRSRRQVNA